MKIKDICVGVTDGSHNPPQGIETSNYYMLSSKNIFDNEITFDDPRYLTESDFEQENKRTKIGIGDVLLTIVGTVGRTAVVDETTGTRYLNVSGMLPYENKTADYIEETHNHVLYRVTPIFDGDNLLASGVLMEAKSVEDNGAGLQFNIYAYNIQPGILIDYCDGESSAQMHTP